MKKFIVIENYYSIYVVSIRDTIEEAQADIVAQIQTFSKGCDESKIKKFIGNDRAWAIFDDDTTGEHEKTELYICELANESFASKITHKYTLDNYKDFCKDALVAPDADPHDWDEWFDNHKIKISTGEHSIELEYNADTVNEIEFALKEIDEAINGDGTPTTGNYKYAIMRPAEFKDVVRYYVFDKYEQMNSGDLKLCFKSAIEYMVYMNAFSSTYKKIMEQVYYNNEKFDCDFSRFNPETICDVSSEAIKRIITDWIGTHIEVSYDPKTDKTFVIDYTFIESGEFLGWYWGSPNETDTKYYIGVYISNIFKQ